jgi:malate dehydrogenase (oxaloacetate-decarboxylating)
VYTAFAGIDPNQTLPIMLDAGTNNQALLDDPLYIGWRHPRVSGEEYNRFIDKFVHACKKKFPDLFLHWEDFGRTNAYRNLSCYQENLCTFNDDIQGTGVVALAALMAALRHKKQALPDQRIVIFGAGSAGMGVAERIALAITAESDEAKAKQCFYLVDRDGLVTTSSEHITPAQAPFAKDPSEIADWQVANPSAITLEEVVTNLKPTVLIGTSAQPSAFTESIIKTMAASEAEPVIFVLSNPNARSEAKPQDIYDWTNGKAFLASGSPYPPVDFGGKTYPVSQCNNYLAFPGIGLGVTAVKANYMSDTMLMAASEAISKQHYENPAQLLPTMSQAPATSFEIAVAVAKQAIKEGHSPMEASVDIEALVKASQWEPSYLRYRYNPELKADNE